MDDMDEMDFMDEEFDEDLGDPREDELEDALEECGLQEDGDCLHAGSEWCDFKCPWGAFGALRDECRAERAAREGGER